MYKAQRVVGTIFKQRLEIKQFATLEARQAFMRKHEHSLCNPTGWSLASDTAAALKPGTYAYVGGVWKNVKTLPPEVLAHV